MDKKQNYHKKMSIKIHNTKYRKKVDIFNIIITEKQNKKYKILSHFHTKNHKIHCQCNLFTKNIEKIVNNLRYFR